MEEEDLLDTEWVRDLSFAAFGFFILVLVTGFRERRRYGKLKKSVGIKIHPAAKVGWIFILLIMAMSLIVPPFHLRLLYWNMVPASWIADALQVSGFVLMMVGGSLFLWAKSALGRHMVPEIMLAEGHRLVTEGPYQWIRHPAYSSTILIFAGLSLFYVNPLLGVLTLITATMALYRSRKEEELFLSSDAFGKQYSEYKKRTGTFLPKL